MEPHQLKVVGMLLDYDDDSRVVLRVQGPKGIYRLSFAIADIEMTMSFLRDGERLPRCIPTMNTQRPNDP
jgi:hypothetical protein